MSRQHGVTRTSPSTQPLRRVVRAALVALLAAALAVIGTASPVAAQDPVPKVVLIVGPAGSVTDTYRKLAERAATVAERAGAVVVRVYSPHATWPAVKQAAADASILVYLGHGNGWPSRYRDELYPPTQNGFGLNPVAGVDDRAHQYFGEAAVEDLELAPNAVVVLSHLCYASGNSEPGLPEGTEADAIQRVDNFAAGFIRAGAEAVVAEAHLGPAYYVRALLSGTRSIERIWRSSPTARGRAFAVDSVRSPGFAAHLDPDRPDGGYYRSLVSRGVTAPEVRASATGSTAGLVIEPPVAPSLASLGLSFGEPALMSLPIAATTGPLALPIEGKAGRKVPAGARVGVRWDPILLDPAPAAAPAATASPAEPPDVDLVVPEQIGSVVSLQQVERAARGLGASVTYPDAPGLYRLVLSLHDPAGVAYDAATQELLTPVIVRVGGPYAMAFGVPATLALQTGEPATVGVRILNAGSQPWDAESATPPAEPIALLIWLRTSRAPARVVATWVSTQGLPVPPPASRAIEPEAAVPGGAAAVPLDLVAPSMPGDYLLLLDVVTPTHGPLSALGSSPALVRVTVTAPWPPVIEPPTIQPSDPGVPEGS